MFEKLSFIEERYRELTEQVSDPEVIADQEKFRKLCKEAGEENYATTFLTDECCTTAWNWVKNPWPWEYSCQCGDKEQDCPCRKGRN